MAEAFVGEIRIVGFNFAPQGWAACDGQLLPISQNTALFSLLGTNFGGNGQTNFGLPNLQGRAAMHWQQGPGLSNYDVGQTGGESAVTLNTSQMPAHAHGLQGDRETASLNSTNGNLTANTGPGASLYAAALPSSPPSLAPQAVVTAGNSQPHNNLAPYQTMMFVIALQGIYPSRS